MQIIKCKAAILEDYGKPLVVDEVEVAPPAKGEVRIKVLATGLCHSDLFCCEGGDKNWFKVPQIPGHEAVGVVESLGSGVTNVKPGDIVIPNFIPQCGSCRPCKSAKTNLCEKLDVVMKGWQLDGTSRVTWRGTPVRTMTAFGSFSEYIVAPEISVVKVKDGLKPQEACLLGCAIPTGYCTVTHAVRPEPDSTVAIWGLGGIGLAVALGCKALGVSSIIGIDLNSDKFDIAHKMGCTEFLNPREVSRPLHQKLAEMTGGGLDYAFNAVGNIDCLNESIRSVHPFFGEAVAIGLIPEGVRLEADVFPILTGRKIRGTILGGIRPKDVIPELVDLALAGQLPLSDFVSHTFSLENINEGLDLLHSGKVIRSVVVM